LVGFLEIQWLPNTAVPGTSVFIHWNTEAAN